MSELSRSVLVWAALLIIGLQTRNVAEAEYVLMPGVTHLFPPDFRVEFDQAAPLEASLLDRALVAAYRLTVFPSERKRPAELKRELGVEDEQIEAAMPLIRKNDDGFTIITAEQYKNLQRHLHFTLNDMFRFDTENAVVMAANLAAQVDIEELATEAWQDMTSRLVTDLLQQVSAAPRPRRIFALVSLFQLPLTVPERQRVEEHLRRTLFSLVDEPSLQVNLAVKELRLALRPLSPEKQVAWLTRMVGDLNYMLSRQFNLHHSAFLKEVAKILGHRLQVVPEFGAPALDLLDGGSSVRVYDGLAWFEFAWDGLERSAATLQRLPELYAALEQALRGWTEKGYLSVPVETQIERVKRYLQFQERHEGREERRRVAGLLMVRALTSAKYNPPSFAEQEKVFAGVLDEVADSDLTTVYRAHLDRGIPEFYALSPFEHALITRLQKAIEADRDMAGQLLRVTGEFYDRDLVLLAALARSFERTDYLPQWRAGVRGRVFDSIMRILRSEDERRQVPGVQMIEFLRAHLPAQMFYDAMVQLRERIESTFSTGEGGAIYGVVKRYAGALAPFGQIRVLDMDVPCRKLLSLQYYSR